MNRILSFLRIALLASLVFLGACAQRLDLHSGLTEADANEILSALISAGIPAEKIQQKEGFSIQVPAPRSADAFSILTAQGLPRTKQNGMGQVFKKEGLISSPMEERVRYLYALSQELERTLSSMDGVIVARVHIVLPERLNLGDPVVPSSAAVFIKHQPDVNFTLHTSKVRSLVFNSIPGLSGDAFEKVTIVAMPATLAQTPVASMSVLGPLQYETRNQNLLIAYAVLAVVLWLVSLGGLFYLMRRHYRSLNPADMSASAGLARTPASNAQQGGANVSPVRESEPVASSVVTASAAA